MCSFVIVYPAICVISLVKELLKVPVKGLVIDSTLGHTPLPRKGFGTKRPKKITKF